MVKLLKPMEAAENLRMHVMTVYRLARTGELPCIRYGQRGIRFSEKALNEWVEARGNKLRGVKVND
jgi:excisionase family DNA binding protein